MKPAGTASPAPRRPPYDASSLLEVAVAVFNERGYDGTSMEDLARAAGITKSSFYHHVDGKQALLAAACDRALGALFAVRDEPASQRGRAVVRFEYVLLRTTQILLTELPYVTLLLRVRGNTPVEQTALERRREFDRYTADLLAQAMADGDLRADIDPALATRLTFGMVTSLTEWYRPSGETPPDAVAKATVDLILRGLRP
jgi:AcrR family transcriptional regulator